MKYILILVLTTITDGQTVTNMVTVDNFTTKARCEQTMRNYLDAMDSSIKVEFKRCEVDHGDK